MPRKYSPEETLMRIKAWCDMQERCQSEVRTKLISWGVYHEELEEVLAELIAGNYLNEERFAQAFVSGKFRIKKWGRNKIVQHLKQKGISDYSIKSGLREIDDGEYLETLDKLIARKTQDYHRLNEFDRKGKTAQYLVNRGYEKSLVWDRIKMEQ